MKSAWRFLLLAGSGALPLSLGLMAVSVQAEKPTGVLADAQALPETAAAAYQPANPENENLNSAEILLIDGELSLEAPKTGVLLLLGEDSAMSSESLETETGEAVTNAELPPEATVSDSPEAAETASDELLSGSSESTGAAAPPNSEPPGAETALEPPQEAVIETETQAEAEATQADTSNPQSSPEDQLNVSPDVPRDPETWTRQKLLIRADRFYLAGDLARAEQWYREAKDPFWSQGPEAQSPPEAIADPELLSPGAAVYWREAQAGIEMGLETRTLIPLSLLVEQYPEFVLGHIRYAEVLRQYDRPEEATEILQQALQLYPSQPDLLIAQVDDLTSREQWLEASISARQFTIFNPDHPDAEALALRADESLVRFRRQMRGNLINNAIANMITGAVGFALTGGLFGPMTALNSTMMLLQGEQSIGEQVAAQAQKQLPMMMDPQVLAYVNEIGTSLAEVAGRDEFDYEFHVIMDEELNAFALPGGKVFVNAGAIMAAHSEAELAGLLAHEIAHSVLSHGFQMATQGNLTASITQFIPYAGNIVTNLLVSGYSREMEQQADILGTQMLSASGYAADGLHNLMTTLEEKSEGRPALTWFASHPSPDNRVQYLKELVDRGGYNRYTYEGVKPHLAVQIQVRRLMTAYEREAGIKRPEENEGNRRRSSSLD